MPANGHLMIFLVVVGCVRVAARANGGYVTLVREEGAIMSLVLPTYVADISQDIYIYIFSSRHSP